MSAILGIFNRNRAPVNRADLEKMVNLLAYRGPDGAAVWIDEAVGLGHRMLWTTPESLQEKLPLVDERGPFALTADARLDNRAELLALLDLRDRPPETISDSALILAAYLKWGESCAERLLGDFAFALWDGRSRTLFCARDHFGAKQLHYYQSKELFVFATDAKALFCVPGVPQAINELKIGDFLLDNYEDKALTFYQDVFRLPPASTLLVSENDLHLRTYWALDPEREIRLKSDQEYADRFREIFTEAVRCRLRSAFPVGSMLSGGLDSSAVTCVVRDLLAPLGKLPLDTFSAVFPDVPQSDERPYIEQVIAQGGIAPHYLQADQISPLHDLERMLWHIEEPFGMPNLFLNHGLYEMAQAHNVRIMLDGIDGDTTVSHGFDYLVELAYQGRWADFRVQARTIRECFGDARTESNTYVKRYGFQAMDRLAAEHRWLVLLRSLDQLGRIFGFSRRELIKEHLIWPLMGREKSAADSPLPEIVNPTFAAEFGLTERMNAVTGRARHTLRGYRQNHFERVTNGHLPLAFEALDRTAAMFGLVACHPFEDIRLLEYCLALPADQKLRDGLTRFVMHKALAGILPPAIQTRAGKTNLSHNAIRSLVHFESQRLEAIPRSTLAGEKYFNLPALKKAYQDFFSQPSRITLPPVWATMMLEAWLNA